MTKFGMMAVLMLGMSAGTLIAAETPKPSVVEAAKASADASVEGIDYETRMITLKNSKGSMTTLEVGPEVARFNEIKKGDIIHMDYLASVSVVVRSSGTKMSAAEGTHSMVVRNKTPRPSAVTTETELTTAVVEKIDVKNRKATLRGPKGNTVVIDVAPDVQHLENVKPGDEVAVQVTRTVALEVRSPKK